MSIKTIAQIKTDADTNVEDNTTKNITPADIRTILKDLADSAINRIDDKALLNLRVYNVGRAYEVGEASIFTGVLYEAVNATTGTFVPGDWVAIGGGGGGISGLTTNFLTKATSATTIGDSLINEIGGFIAINRPSGGLAMFHVTDDNPTRGIVSIIQNIAAAAQNGVQLQFSQNAIDNWVIGQPSGVSAFVWWRGRSTTADGAEEMRLNSVGLGIGTAPFSLTKFSVQSAGAGTGWTAQFQNSTGTSNSLMIRDDGKIGILTSTPMSPLTIATGSNEGLTLRKTAGGTDRLKVFLGNGAGFADEEPYWVGANVSFRYAPNGTVRMQLIDNGFAINHAISTNEVALGWRLFVNATGGTELIKVVSSDAADSIIAISTNGTGWRGRIYVDHANQLLNLAAANSDIAFITGAGGATEGMRLTVAGNFLVGTTTFGTSATKVVAIGSGVEPTTSPVDIIQLFSVDTDDTLASLGLRTEQAVAAEVVSVSNTLKVRINGVQYKLLLNNGA